LGILDFFAGFCQQYNLLHLPLAAEGISLGQNEGFFKVQIWNFQAISMVLSDQNNSTDLGDFLAVAIFLCNNFSLIQS
jgi:hypothetical protein